MRRDVGIFLGILGSPVHKTLMEMLETTVGSARRLFIEVLLKDASRPSRMAQTLLNRYRQCRDFVSDLLIAAGEVVKTFWRY